MRLRRRRAMHAGRRSARWHASLTVSVLALLVGGACLAPLATRAWSTSMSAEEASNTASTRASTPSAAVVPLEAVAPTPLVLVSRPLPTPSPSPLPQVVPSLTPTGQKLLDGIVADRSAVWVRNTSETPLLSGPTADAVVFTRLPQWSLLRQVDSRPDWLLVDYAGDGATRQAGPGWVRAGDVGRVDAPTVWLTSSGAGSLWSAADASAKRVLDVPSATLMEVVGPHETQGARVHVRLPGDGRAVPPAEGWLDGNVAARAATPAASQLPWAYPDDLRADVRIQVPYRTQLDGSDFASANCGPTVLGMALETFGMNLAPPDLRGQVLDTEDFSAQDDDAGSYIWALARVAESHGLRTHGLYDADGSGYHRWTADEIRDSVRGGRPVIVQVVYRGLPGREDSGYYGDHYIIVTGLLGDSFLYNDPIGGSVAREAPGYDRLMSPGQLERAMHASDTPYAYTAFGLSRS